MATDTLTRSVLDGDAARPNVYRNFIDGEWVEASTGETFENRNPADTRDVVGIFQKSAKADVDAAVNAAKRAFEHLDEFHGVDPATASNRLHKLKARGGLGPADNVTIGRTGDVYDAKTGRWLGTLTDKSLGK